MNHSRKQPGVAFWATVVVVVVLVAYPLSFGPACWAVDRGWIAARPVARVFRPILAFYWESAPIDEHSGFASRIIDWYGTVGAKHMPVWILTRLADAAGLVGLKSGPWPRDSSHDVPHPGF